MRLAPVNPPMREGQRLLCCRCGAWTSKPVADLDGPPFAAYYCPECAEAVTEEGQI